MARSRLDCQGETLPLELSTSCHWLYLSKCFKIKEIIIKLIIWSFVFVLMTNGFKIFMNKILKFKKLFSIGFLAAFGLFLYRREYGYWSIAKNSPGTIVSPARAWCGCRIFQLWLRLLARVLRPLRPWVTLTEALPSVGPDESR